MTVEWEEFTRKANYRSEMTRVSLNARGHFLLNRKAVEELGNPEAIVLLFDRSSRRIGLKPSPSTIEHAYELKRHGSSPTYYIHAKSFCAYYGIDVGDSIVFNDVQVDDGVIVLNLDNVTEVIRRARITDFGPQRDRPFKPAQSAKFSTLLRMREPNEE